MRKSKHHYAASVLLILTSWFWFLCSNAPAQSAFVRVSQVGYEAGGSAARAYFMSSGTDADSTFTVVEASGHVLYSGRVGEHLGVWSNSKQLAYQVYALDFSVPCGRSYTIHVAGAHPALSPHFAVDRPGVLYPGLLLNTLFFYETQRDGPEFIRNALRTAPGHLKDESATRTQTPALDTDDNIDQVPPALPLTPAGLPNIDASGGWWDAGDYAKYVETVSYTVSLMEIGIRDFPWQMGPHAMQHPPAPPNAVSYAGDSHPGAPVSSDFTEEARFGVDWLLRMWDSGHKRLTYQVDNTQDWDYYGEGEPSSTAGICGGTYDSPFCLLGEYDIWMLPQVQDHFQLDQTSAPCDPYTTIYICNRPAYTDLPDKPSISPNLAGRLSAAFALCAQIHQRDDSALANRCLKAGREVFALAKTDLPDPAPAIYGGSCTTCLLTVVPFDGYPETVWDDDMELGAAELARAVQDQTGPASTNTPTTDSSSYLRQAAHFAKRYITNIADPGEADTLNLYDVSGLAHFELLEALKHSKNQVELEVSSSEVRKQLLKQVDDAIAHSANDAWGFGVPWTNGDTTSHGAGLSVMASEAYSLTHDNKYELHSRRWLANILGANSWGASFIVGDGSTFPNCIQHQVANIAGALNGTNGGTPILWGAATEGPATAATKGLVDGMNRCPADGVDSYRIFNGNNGTFNRSDAAIFRDNVQSYSTTEPGIDLTATSFLMFSWRIAGSVQP